MHKRSTLGSIVESFGWNGFRKAINSKATTWRHLYYGIKIVLNGYFILDNNVRKMNVDWIFTCFPTSLKFINILHRLFTSSSLTQFFFLFFFGFSVCYFFYHTRIFFLIIQFIIFLFYFVVVVVIQFCIVEHCKL